MSAKTDEAPDAVDENTEPEESEDNADTVDYDAEEAVNADLAPAERRFSWKGLLAFGVIPVIVVLLASAAGYLKYQDGSTRSADLARMESVQAATEGTIAMLSYSPENVDAALGGARDRLTGSFRDSYTQLVDDVVIPGSREKKISATASVPAAASMTASADHATVMVYVNQTTIIGADAPTDSASAVEVTLDRVAGKWLISGFEPK